MGSLLALCSLASRATETTYVWTIDWADRPDQTGTLVFDDGGDNTPRTFSWFYPRPPFPLNQIKELGSFSAAGSLSFDGSLVTAFSGCNDIFTFCSSGGGIVLSGYTSANFFLSGSGSATFATYAGNPRDPGCAPGSLVGSLPSNCFAFSTGVTTFAAASAVTPVPEPSTWALMLGGLLGTALVARRLNPRALSRLAAAGRPLRSLRH